MATNERYPGSGNTSSMEAADQIVTNITGPSTTGTRAASVSVSAANIGQMVTLLYADIPNEPLDSGVLTETSTIAGCGISDSNCTEHIFNVDCQYIATRHMKIKEYNNIGSPKKGTIILTTGLEGNIIYSELDTSTLSGWNEAYDIPKQTRIQLQNNGFRAYEIVWTDPASILTYPDGWRANTNVSGAGRRKAMCGYAAAVKWIQQRETTLGGINSDVICAEGNSAGGAQIAYGLAYYGLESVIDMAILTGGPPFAGPDTGFGGNPSSCSGDGLDLATRFSDFVMGWVSNGNYAHNECITSPPTKQYVPPTAVTALGFEVILPSSTTPYNAYRGDYIYPNTRINILGATTDPVYQSAQTYHNHLVSSNPAPNPGAVIRPAYSTSQYPSSVIDYGHIVDQYNVGANDIRTLVNSECRNWP